MQTDKNREYHEIFKVERAISIDGDIKKIDIADWLYSLSDEDYRSFSKNHIGFGLRSDKDNLRGFVSIEFVSGAFMVHHYKENLSEKKHIRVISESSDFYIMGIIPAQLKTVWELEIKELTQDNYVLVCSITASHHNKLLSFLAIMDSWYLKYAVGKHAMEELEGFRDDILKKQLT